MESEMNNESDTQTALPKYKCHKEVWAAKITSLDENTSTMFFAEIHGRTTVSPEYVARHQPEVGGYYVVYADGYESYSPAKAFEEGYTRIGVNQ